MVHRWAAATGEARGLAYEAAFAVRQVEIGLTSRFSLVLGSTLTVFGLALLLSTRYPAWLGEIGVLGGLGTVALGLEQASSGFSNLALTGFMVMGFADIIWAILAGLLMWRLAPSWRPAGVNNSGLECQGPANTRAYVSLAGATFWRIVRAMRHTGLAECRRFRTC